MKLLPFMLILFLGSTLLCQDANHKGPDSSDQQYISLLQLIVTPEKFDSKKVIVTGFLQAGREEDLLFLHQEDQRHGILENAIRIIPSKEMRNDNQNMNLKYVRVVGFFKTADRRKSPFSAGVIRDIERVYFWSDPAHPLTERLNELHK